MAECGCEVEIKNKEQSKLLMILLAINAVMFFVEFGTGILAESTGLIADSLDMLADAAVYGISLYAVGHSALKKVRAAHVSGIFQIALAMGVAVDVVRRFIFGSEPESVMMMIVGGVALVANVTCLTLIFKHREGEVHMRASWIFSKNDVLANLGIILGGVLVAASGSRLPDLLIGAVITLIVLRGGLHIIKDAAAERCKVLPDGA